MNKIKHISSWMIAISAIVIIVISIFTYKTVDVIDESMPSDTIQISRDLGVYIDNVNSLIISIHKYNTTLTSKTFDVVKRNILVTKLRISDFNNTNALKFTQSLTSQLNEINHNVISIINDIHSGGLIDTTNLERQKSRIKRLYDLYTNETLDVLEGQESSSITLQLLVFILLLSVFSIVIINLAFNYIGKQDAEKIEMLTHAKEQAETANLTKLKFLATMSHELRTPLNAINGFSELMISKTKGELNDGYIEYARIINESGNHLLGLINDILDISKIDTDNLELRYSAFDLKSIVRFMSSLYMQRQHVKFIVTDNTTISCISADNVRFKQMITNLLDNAFKFTQSGSVEFKLSNDENQLCVEVIDTGIGIPKDKIDDIFKPFVKLNNAYNEMGSGIGLTLVKRLVELHGGEISVESEVKVGTHFTFTIPLCEKHKQ